MPAAEVALIMVVTTEAFRRVLAPLELTEDGLRSMSEPVTCEVFGEYEALAAVSAFMLALLVGRVIPPVVCKVGRAVEACAAVSAAVGVVAGPHLLLVAPGAQPGR